MASSGAVLGSRALRSRAGVVASATILALIATLAVFLYVQAERDAVRVSASVPVLVATRDIPAGSELSDMIASGAFTTKYLQPSGLVRDHVSDLVALEGQRTSAAIVEGQQVSSAVLEGDPTAVAGGALGIPDGMQAVSISLDQSRVVGGDIHAGDRLTVYASFDGQDRGAATFDATFSGTLTDGRARVRARGFGPVTIALVSHAKVLKVIPPDETAAAQERTSLVTLALEPRDTQRLIYAQENGKVWLGLEPPGSEPATAKPLYFGQVLK